MFSKVLVLLALGFDANALVPSVWTTAPRRASPATVVMKAAQLSKFEKRKSTWKGQTSVVEEDEVDVGFTYAEFDTLISEQSVSFLRGDVVPGTVVQFQSGGSKTQGALIDIGAKSAAFLPLREAALLPVEDISDAIDVDEKRQFQVISEENTDGQLMLSIRRIEFKEAWDQVDAAYAEDACFDGEVLAVNKGGCVVAAYGLRAFLPGSHLCGQLPSEELIGNKYPLKFLEVDREENKLVVSNRRAMVENSMVQIKRGDVCTGVVKAIKPYGAFVEINGISGLLHISQISYDRIENLEEVLSPNQLLKCMIIDHDKANGRIALSTKTLEPEPGDMIKDQQGVFDNAEATAAKYHLRMEEEREAREAAAKDIVMGLGDLDASTFDSASDLDQILAPSEE